MERSVKAMTYPAVNRLGVCSWSLRARDAGDLARRVRATGLDAIQLALDPLRTGEWSIDELMRALDSERIAVRSGMMIMAGEDYATLESIRRTGGVVPDATWSRNLAAAFENARLARLLGIRLVTFHAGFVPHDVADPGRAVIVGRLRELARAFAQHDVLMALETGQETAGTMRALVEELADSSVGVNFDPANMILYGMGDPVAALRTLAPHVRQLHLKDALGSRVAGTWGTEVPLGEGEVDWTGIFETLRSAGVRGDLVIERESGADPVADVIRARSLAERYLRERLTSDNRAAQHQRLGPRSRDEGGSEP